MNIAVHTIVRLWARIEHALNLRFERKARARYWAATGHDLPREERAAWLRQAADDDV